VDADAQSLNGALFHAVIIIVLAGRSQAAIALGAPNEFPGLGVYSKGADFGAAAALDALGFVAVDPVLAQGILESGRSGHRLPGLPRGPGFDRNYFLCMCHIIVFYRFSFLVYRFSLKGHYGQYF
jgi:hypothetical protein